MLVRQEMNYQQIGEALGVTTPSGARKKIYKKIHGEKKTLPDGTRGWKKKGLIQKGLVRKVEEGNRSIQPTWAIGVNFTQFDIIKKKVIGRSVAPANYQIPSPIVCGGGGGSGQPHHPVNVCSLMLATCPNCGFGGPMRSGYCPACFQQSPGRSADTGFHARRVI